MNSLESDLVNFSLRFFFKRRANTKGTTNFWFIRLLMTKKKRKVNIYEKMVETELFLNTITEKILDKTQGGKKL